MVIAIVFLSKPNPTLSCRVQRLPLQGHLVMLPPPDSQSQETRTSPALQAVIKSAKLCTKKGNVLGMEVVYNTWTVCPVWAPCGLFKKLRGVTDAPNKKVCFSSYGRRWVISRSKEAKTTKDSFIQQSYA